MNVYFVVLVLAKTFAADVGNTSRYFLSTDYFIPVIINK